MPRHTPQPTPRPAPKPPHRRGVIMLFVLATVTLAVSAGLGGLMIQRARADRAALIADLAVARAEAKNALELALQNLSENRTTWRTLYPTGKLLDTRIPGTNTIATAVLTDDGDGLLHDDPADPLTLTATAVYARARARLAVTLEETAFSAEAATDALDPEFHWPLHEPDGEIIAFDNTGTRDAAYLGGILSGSEIAGQSQDNEGNPVPIVRAGTAHLISAAYHDQMINQAGTITAWFRPDGDDNAKRAIFNMNDIFDALPDLEIYLEGMRLTLIHQTMFGLNPITLSAITPDTWHHLAYVYSPSGATMYLNGVPVGTRPTDPGGQPWADGFAASVHIGATYGKFLFTAREQLNGALRAVALFDRNLTQDEITSMQDIPENTVIDIVPQTLRWITD